MRAITTAALGVISLVTGASLFSSQGHANAIAEFYAGKRITLYVGFPPGGGYDIYSRLVARHLGRHLPGKPDVILNNMPGEVAGSLRRMCTTSHQRTDWH